MSATLKRFLTKNGLDNNGNSIANIGTSGNTLAVSGAYAVTLTVTGATNVTLPTSGTLATLTSTVSAANNLAGGSNGYIAYQTGSGATTFLAPGSNTQVLTLAGGVPTWANPAAGFSNPMTTTGDIIYASSGSTPARLAVGTTGQVLSVVAGIPSWSSSPTLAGTNFSSIPNGALSNSSVTIGSTSVSLGATATTIVGLASVTSTSFTGALTGNASSATNIASGSANQIPYQTGSGATSFYSAANYGVHIYGSTGVPTSLAGAAGVLQGSASANPVWTTTPTLTGTNFTGIPNGALTNSSVTVGSTSISLGSSATTIAGLVSVSSTTFVGALTGTASGNLALSGGTLSGTVTFTSGTVTGVANPVAATDVVNLQYLQTTIAGLAWKDSAMARTTANLSATYSNGTSGVGATLTNSGTQAAFVTDGYTANLGDRILVMGQTTQTQNGIYTVTTVGSGSSNWVLTRAIDANTAVSLDNATLYVVNGTTYANTGWTQTTAAPTIGTSNIVFVQNAGSNLYVQGTGIAISGNTISNAGVVSLTGTTNQITVSASTGAITLSLPQNINSGAAPTFAGTNFTSIPNGALTNSSLTVNGTAISLGGSGTVTAAAGTLTGTTLNSTVVSSSLTSVGTLTALTVSGTTNSSTIVIDSEVTHDYVTISTSSTSAGQVIDSRAIATYRSVKYTISITNGTSYQLSEVYLIQDGTLAYINEINDMPTGSSLATFDATISGGNLQLLVTPANSSSTVFRCVVLAIGV